MNSETKLGIKLELMRDLLENINSDNDQATILWMREYNEELFHKIKKKVSPKNFVKTLEIIKVDMKKFLPNPIRGLFVVSVIMQIIEDLNKTNHYKDLEPLLDACYNLDDSEQDNFYCRIQADYFVQNLYEIVDKQ